MGFELTLARRLAWKAEGRRHASAAVGVAVAGVALSVAVMLLSVAVMLGFKGEVTKKILALDDAITITGYSDDNTPASFNPAEVLDAIDLPAGARTTVHTFIPAILKTPDDFMGLHLESRAGDDAPADSVIVISRSTARKLRLAEGDRVAAYFFTDGRLRTRALTVGLPYSSGFAEHDDAIAYCSPRLPEQLLGLAPGHAHSLGITGLEPDQIEPLASRIYSELLNAFYEGKLTAAYGISTIFQTRGSFFSWLGLLDTNVVVIIVLMSLVSGFTLISSLFIIILERVRTIGLLKALGATNRQIRRTFMFMAERLVIRGLVIGNALGIGLVWLQSTTHILPLDQASYYVDFVPVTFSPIAIIALNAGALALSWLVLLLPAIIIARVSPATTMRYD